MWRMSERCGASQIYGTEESDPDTWQNVKSVQEGAECTSTAKYLYLIYLCLLAWNLCMSNPLSMGIYQKLPQENCFSFCCLRPLDNNWANNRRNKQQQQQQQQNLGGKTGVLCFGELRFWKATTCSQQPRSPCTCLSLYVHLESARRLQTLSLGCP